MLTRSNVFMVAHLRPAETVLLHGGASGIGTMAIQLAKAVGAKVIVAAVREHVWPLIESGVVKPVVDRVMPLTAVADAHRVVEASEQVGKIVLQA
ncbi:NADPH:quinone reductase-like Zn-dependent oxidoreductase [Kitasatospora sp. MAP12-15]|nr:NADPH:quinone reductase-like Zn-dependent oxidoreductase [Kitasatospora sp. MAP12-44]